MYPHVKTKVIDRSVSRNIFFNQITGLNMPTPTPSAPVSIFIRYASDNLGTNFSSTPDISRKYIGFLAKTSTTPPTPEDYAGKWQKYIGEVDPRDLNSKRNNADLTVVIQKFNAWTWTSTDESIPEDFLSLANRLEAPRPRYEIDRNGVGYWVGVNFFNEDGSLKYECYIKQGEASDTSVTFRFKKFPDDHTTFQATATRVAADDPTAVAATILLTGTRLKELVTEATSFEDFKSKILAEL